MERSQSHILMVLLPPQQCILILKVLIWRNKLWRRGSSSFATGYPINHLGKMAVGSGTQSSCSRSLWESPQLMRWQRGRLQGVGCFCFSPWAFPRFSMKPCHSTLCTSSLLSGAGPGLTDEGERVIHEARPHLSLRGSWPETRGLLPAKGTGTPCFCRCCYRPC